MKKEIIFQLLEGERACGGTGKKYLGWNVFFCGK
jgi:hypothetical protein